jgi:hypothetical protein
VRQNSGPYVRKSRAIDRALWFLSAAVTSSASSDFFRRIPQRGDVLQLALPPRPLAALAVQRVAARLDHRPDVVSELVADRAQDVRTLALGGVLDRIVQQGGDRLVLAAAVFEHERANAHQVREVRHPRTLAHVEAVALEREVKGVGGAPAERSGTQCRTGFEGGKGAHQSPSLGVVRPV